MKIYVVKDVLASSIGLTFTAENDQLARRTIESYVCAPAPNSVNMFINDKQVYAIGELDKVTLAVKPYAEPQFIFNVFEIRDAVLAELCKNEQFVKAQVAAIKKQKEILEDAPITRKTGKPNKKVDA